jgi:DNA-binding CsgD family transcriptional regulator
MSPRDFEALSALFDGERVCAQSLLASLRRPGVLEFLAHMAGLRLCVQQDTAVPSESWCRAMRRMLARADELAALSPTVRTSRRQAEILKCLLDGCSEKEVGDHLNIKQSTVHSHVKRLHQKLGVHNRGQLLAAALRILAGVKNESR